MRIQLQFWLLTVALPALAQRRRSRAEEEAAAAAIAAGGCGFCGTLIFIPIALIILNIALLIWVAKDSKARGMDNSGMWVILLLFLGPIGLIVYLSSRPGGTLIGCRNCGNQRLQAAVRCPHCGAG